MLPKVKSALKADLNGNCQYSFPACYGIRHLRCPFRGRFAGLSEYRFSIPAPESHRSVAVLAPIKGRSSHGHIPSSRSFGCNRLSGNKKSRHTNAYRLPAKRIDLSFLRWWLHIHVTGFEIQSRNCPLHLSDRRQLKAIQKRRYFLLAYRRRCPAESRLSHSNVKNAIQLSLSFDSILLYLIEQVFVKTF